MTEYYPSDDNTIMYATDGNEYWAVGNITWSIQWNQYYFKSHGRCSSMALRKIANVLKGMLLDTP